MAVEAPVPLLHVAEQAEHALGLNTDVAAIAAIACGLILAAVWWPVAGPRLRQPLRAASRVVLPVALVAALLPSIVPYDHIVPVQPAEDVETHSAHCHVAPGSCADAPVSAGPGQFVFSEPMLLAPALTLLAVVGAVTVLVGRVPPPSPRPPLATAYA